MLRKVFLCVVAICLLSSPVLQADEDHAEGMIELLYRNVSIDDSVNKYYEDVNLRTGGRLSQFWLDVDTAHATNLVDEVTLKAYGGGGDPYQRYSFGVAKADAYNLDLNYRVFDHYYRLGAYDYHYFDTTRKLGNIRLEVFPVDGLKLHFGYDRGLKEGMTRLTKDAYNTHEEFGFWVPQDVETQTYRAGLLWNIGDYFDIFVEQALRENDTIVDWDLEGYGTNYGFEGVMGNGDLDYYEWREVTDSETPITTIQLHGNIMDRVDVRAAYMGSNTDLDSEVDSMSEGIDYESEAFMHTFDAWTDLDEDNTIYDLDVSFRIIDRVIFHALYRNFESDAEGTMTKVTYVDDAGDGISTTEVDEIVNSEYSIDTLAGYFDIMPLDNLRFRLGYKTRDREFDVMYDTAVLRGEEFDSDDDSWLVGFNWKPITGLTLSGRYEDADMDEAFVRTGALEADNAKLKVDYTRNGLFGASAFYRDGETENPDEGYSAETKSLGADFWHRPVDEFKYMLSYTAQEVDIMQHNLFATSYAFGPGPYLDEGFNTFTDDRDVFSASIMWDPIEAVNVNAFFRVSESDGHNSLVTEAPLEIVRTIGQDFNSAGLEVTYDFWKSLYAGVGYKMYDYDEDEDDINDYDANIYILKLGARF